MESAPGEASFLPPKARMFIAPPHVVSFTRCPHKPPGPVELRRAD